MADALSRQQSPEFTCSTLVVSCGLRWDCVQAFIAKDAALQRLVSQIQKGERTPKWFSLENGVLKYKRRIVIPKHCELTSKLLKEYHDSLVGGHAGDLKTYQHLAEEWFWFGMRKDVTKYVQHCHVCQQNKLSTLSPLGLLQPLPIP